MLQTAVNSFGTDAQLMEMLHLVFHQGDKGRNNDTNAFHSHGRHLKGDGLSTTCRH